MSIDVNNPPKFYIVLATLVAVVVLLLTNSIDPTTGAGMIGMIVGYGVGNGVAAQKGQPVEPIFRRRSDETTDR